MLLICMEREATVGKRRTMSTDRLDSVLYADKVRPCRAAAACAISLQGQLAQFSDELCLNSWYRAGLTGQVSAEGGPRCHVLEVPGETSISSHTTTDSRLPRKTFRVTRYYALKLPNIESLLENNCSMARQQSATINIPPERHFSVCVNKSSRPASKTLEIRTSTTVNLEDNQTGPITSYRVKQNKNHWFAFRYIGNTGSQQYGVG
jgi:hypothetical protein